MNDRSPLLTSLPTSKGFGTLGDMWHQGAGGLWLPVLDHPGVEEVDPRVPVLREGVVAWEEPTAGSGGATVLDELDDVTTAGAIDGDALVYDSGSGLWVPGTPAVAVGIIVGSIVTKAANYTATTADDTILCDASGGAFTITLYAASGNAGKMLTIRKVDGYVIGVAIDANGSELIDGCLTRFLSLPGDWVTLQCDGTGWAIVRQGRPNFDTWKPVGIFTHQRASTSNDFVNMTNPTGSGAASASQDADGSNWVDPRTGTTLGNNGGWIASTVHGRREWWSESVTVVKVVETTGIGSFIGWVSNTPTVSNPVLHLAAFRYWTDVDTTAFWRCCTNDGSGSSLNVTTTGVAVTTGVRYALRVEMSPTDVKFFINQVCVAEHTTNLPGLSTGLGWVFRHINIVGGAGSAVGMKHSRTWMASL